VFPPPERGLFPKAARHSLPGVESWHRLENFPQPAVQNHQKTVLVVDSHPKVLNLVSTILRDGDYKVITAISGSLALEQAKNYKGDIDLLLSDFQMDAMSGIDLATQMTVDRPALKVLLMSNFPLGMLVLNEGWHFLAKPFIPSQLRTLVSGLVLPHKPSRFSK